jgi:hypothetical protein
VRLLTADMLYVLTWKAYMHNVYYTLARDSVGCVCHALYRSCIPRFRGGGGGGLWPLCVLVTRMIRAAKVT